MIPLTTILYFLLPALGAALIAPPYIKLLKKLKSEQSFRELGPKSHILDKQGTPTMGAWIFLLPIFIGLFVLYWQTQNWNFIIILVAGAAASALGAVDDIYKVAFKNFKGLDSRTKLIIQGLISVGVCYCSGRLDLTGSWYLSLVSFVWAFLVIAGSSNAFNLTDGLDGLATSISIVSFLGLGLIFVEDYLQMTVLACASLLVFLFFNKKPARVFMGDTGSLSLGTLVAVAAYLKGAELYLLFLALIPVLEAISVMLQVFSAKFSRRFLAKEWRPFKMAPLHHHFELSGWTENKVVFVFVVIQLTALLLFLLLQP